MNSVVQHNESFTLLTHPSSFSNEDIVLNKEIFADIQINDFIRICIVNADSLMTYGSNTSTNASSTSHGFDNSSTITSTLVPFSSTTSASSETFTTNLFVSSGPSIMSTSKDYDLSTALSTQGLIFKVSSLQTGGRLEVSLAKQIADTLNIKPYSRVMVEKIQNPHLYQVDFVELTFKKQFLQRGNMWRFKKSMSGRSGKAIYTMLIGSCLVSYFLFLTYYVLYLYLHICV